MFFNTNDRKLKKLYSTVGEFTMLSQAMEHDIKLIFASLVGNQKMDKTLEDIDNATLGTVVRMLQKLDYSDGKPFFSKGDYAYMGSLTSKRNHLVHALFERFIYEDSPAGYYSELESAFNTADSFLRELKQFAPRLERTRILLVNNRIDS